MRTMQTGFLTATTVAGLLAGAAATSSAQPAHRIMVDPTPLRLVEPRAGTAVSDGGRYVVVTLPGTRPIAVYDTFTGRRSQLEPDCTTAGSLRTTTSVAAGRALIYCATTSTYHVVDLATRRTVAELPDVLEAEGMSFSRPRYGVLGRRWIQASGDCPGRVGCAALYYDYRTGDTRVSMYPDGPEFRSRGAFYDLDAPDLSLRRVCRASIRYDAHVRAYRPPYYVDRYAGLRRCSDGKLIQRFPRSGDVTSDLTPTALAWGVTVPDSIGRPSPYVNVYDLRRRRLLRWRLPTLNGRRAFGTAIVTRCEVFALTSRTFIDRGGGVASIRIHRAHLPSPRDSRCRS